MKSEWQACTIGELCDSVSVTYRGEDERVVLVNTSDVLNGKVLNHTDEPNQNLKGQFKKTFKRNDILYSEIRPANRRFAYIDFDETEKYIASTKLMVIRYRENVVEPKFLYFLLTSNDVIGELQRLAETRSGTFPQITFPAEVATLPVNLPSLPIQRKIASILSALDDKIETNNAICRNLEEQAIALYKSRLIDSIPFERIEDSHEKTTGWRIGTVDDVVEFLDSRRVPLSKSQREKMEKKYPYYGATELMDYVDNYLFDGTFLLLGEDGTVQDENGYPILQYVWGKFWVNNHAHVLTGKGKWSIELLYLLFANTKVSSVVTGAVQPKISQNRLKTVPVVIPPNPILENLSALITPLFAKRRQLSDENHRLASMRDALIPKIVCGEIDLSTII